MRVVVGARAQGACVVAWYMTFLHTSVHTNVLHTETCRERLFSFDSDSKSEKVYHFDVKSGKVEPCLDLHHEIEV